MVLGFIEVEHHTPSTPSLQMLACGRRIAETLRVPLRAIAIGCDYDPIEEELRRHGVACLYSAAHPRLDEYSPTAWAKVISQVISSASPSVVLAAGTDRGNEVMAWLGAVLGQPLATNCIAVNPGKPFAVVRLRWGGSLLEEARIHGSPSLLTIAPQAFEQAEILHPDGIVVETVSTEISEDDLRVRIKVRETAPSDAIALPNARVVVGGGRGVGSSAGFAVLEELAELLHGAVGGSRVATNNGWRPHSQQIGLTGNRISPELYIACGISGAIQHLVGCKGAKRILVINKDPEAPFFKHADYGVVGDLNEIIPALIAEIKNRRNK